MSVATRARVHAARYPRPYTTYRRFDDWTAEDRAALARHDAADGILYAIGSGRTSGELAFALCDLPTWDDLVVRIVADLDGECVAGMVAFWLNRHYQELAGSCPIADAATCLDVTRQRNRDQRWPLPACPIHRPATS